MMSGTPIERYIENIRGHERPGYLGKGIYIAASQIMARCEKGAKFV
jgi:hypothetical protein